MKKEKCKLKQEARELCNIIGKSVTIAKDRRR